MTEILIDVGGNQITFSNNGTMLSPKIASNQFTTNNEYVTKVYVDDTLLFKDFIQTSIGDV